MSTGGGLFEVTKHYAYFLLNRSGAEGFGHSAIAFSNEIYGKLKFYAYMGVYKDLRFENPGKVATFPSDLKINFQELRNRKGWLINWDGKSRWDERFTDCLVLYVPKRAYYDMITLCEKVKKNPGYYSVLDNNCLKFVITKFNSLGIYFTGYNGKQLSSVIPNAYYDSIHSVTGAEFYGSGKYVLWAFPTINKSR